MARRRCPTRWDVLLGITYALVTYAMILVWTRPNRPDASTAAAVLSSLISLVTLAGIPISWQRQRSGSFASALRQLTGHISGRGVVAGVAVGILLFGVLAGGDPHRSALAWAPAMLYGIVSAAVEELFFRGHLQQRFGVLQVPVFALLHGPEGALAAGTAGLVFTALLRMGLLASVAAHTAFNALAALQ